MRQSRPAKRFQVSDAALLAMAGHLSRKLLEHYPTRSRGAFSASLMPFSVLVNTSAISAARERQGCTKRFPRALTRHHGVAIRNERVNL